ncbi:unnamed protein product [Linum tenue]|uniref:Uncharacterized protein n=1 Tax=Linum tenue TaxID=586396 RepID=A0AAV0PTV8_9ROSI|nr:unnamed protein product [Linum tenue]
MVRIRHGVVGQIDAIEVIPVDDGGLLLGPLPVRAEQVKAFLHHTRELLHPVPVLVAQRLLLLLGVLHHRLDGSDRVIEILQLLLQPEQELRAVLENGHHGFPQFLGAVLCCIEDCFLVQHFFGSDFSGVHGDPPAGQKVEKGWKRGSRQENDPGGLLRVFFFPTN